PDFTVRRIAIFSRYPSRNPLCSDAMQSGPTEYAFGHQEVQRSSRLGAQIASRLRDDIILGRLAAVTLLDQEALCREFGTSRMPVRDAFQELRRDGLVVRRGNRTYVAPISRSDLLDTFTMEAMIHGLATRRAVERANRADLNDLYQLH